MLYFGIFDIYFGIRDICPKISLGYLRKLFRNTGYLGSIILGYGLSGIPLNKPHFITSPGIIGHRVQ